MKRLFIAVSLLLITFSCEQESVNLKQPDFVNGGAIKSVFDSTSGRYIAPNLKKDLEGVIFLNDVSELPDPSTYIESAGNERIETTSACGWIQDTWSLTKGSTPCCEQFVSYTCGYVVTGVGGLILTSSNNYYSLVLEYAYLNSNGSLGQRFLIWDGYQYPNVSYLEAYFSVPTGYLIKGIGIRGKYDIQSLVVWYQHLNSSRRLDGTVYYADRGIDADHTWTTRYLPEDEAGYDPTRVAILSFGATATANGTDRMFFDLGNMQ
jgi:hypothetical protein